MPGTSPFALYLARESPDVASAHQLDLRGLGMKGVRASLKSVGRQQVASQVGRPCVPLRCLDCSEKRHDLTQTPPFCSTPAHHMFNCFMFLLFYGSLCSSLFFANVFLCLNPSSGSLFLFLLTICLFCLLKIMCCFFYVCLLFLVFLGFTCLLSFASRVFIVFSKTH